MTKDNGDIDYCKEGECLAYDDEVNIYKEPYPYFGVKRIVLREKHNYPDNNRLECYAIINDIRAKMTDPDFLISERTNHGNILRKPKLSDFCIIVRKKDQCFDIYREIFAEEGIKLNIVFSEDLQQADAIVAFTSLITLIAAMLNEVTDADVPHLFVSVVRSFLFNYTDQQIFDLLTDNGNIDKNSLERIKNDPTYIRINEFAFAHQNCSMQKLVFLFYQ